MSDWELHEEETPTSGDWELEEQQSPKESLMASLAKAPFRIGQDIGQSAFNQFKNIPEYLNQAQTEVPGIFSALAQHPQHALGQASAGLTELGHNLLNLPHNIGQYTSNRLNLLPQSIAEKIPYQRDISEDINKLYGKPEYAGESLIRGIARNAPQLYGMSKLNPMQLTAKNVTKDILNTRKEMSGKYNKLYDNIWKEANTKGLGDLSISKPDIDIDNLKKYSPPKKITRVDDFMKNPTIENAHAAKSDLLKIQRALEKKETLIGGEKKQYDSVSKAIDSIQSNMFKGKEGLIDKDLMSKYIKVQKGYKKEAVPYQNKAIKQYLAQDISAKQLLNKLNKGSFAVKRGMNHPALLLHKPITKAFLGGLGIAGGGAGIYDYLRGGNED